MLLLNIDELLKNGLYYSTDSINWISINDTNGTKIIEIIKDENDVRFLILKDEQPEVILDSFSSEAEKIKQMLIDKFSN